MMNAIHSVWTKPNPSRYNEDFEILTTILSALKWREKNGSIGLVTDTKGADFYKRYGMDVIWDNGIDVCLDDICVNPSVFWAAGKIFALARQQAPIAVLDTDFIVWDYLDFNSYSNIAVIHSEELNDNIYPGKEYFKIQSDYRFDNRLDWNVNPFNTAFYIIKDNAFIKQYTAEAIRFMENTTQTADTLIHMVFAEQRLFGMCAQMLGTEVTELSNLQMLFGGKAPFTHTWGMKQQMRDNPGLRHSFCRRCLERILSDYPHMKPVITGVDCLVKYFE